MKEWFIDIFRHHEEEGTSDIVRRGLGVIALTVVTLPITGKIGWAPAAALLSDEIGVFARAAWRSAREGTTDYWRPQQEQSVET